MTLKTFFRAFWGPDAPPRPVLIGPTVGLPSIDQMSPQQLSVVATRQRDHITELNKYIDYLEDRLNTAVKSANPALNFHRPDLY